MFLLLGSGRSFFLIFRARSRFPGGYAANLTSATGDDLRTGVRLQRHPASRLALLAYEGPIRVGWFGFGTNPWTNHRFVPMPTRNGLSLQIRRPSLSPTVPEVRASGHHRVLLFAIASAWNLARAAIAREGPLSDLAAGMFGAFVAVAIMIRGVALSFDFGATWLFVAGFAASLQASRQIARLANYGASSNMMAATQGEDPRHTAQPAARSGI